MAGSSKQFTQWANQYSKLVFNSLFRYFSSPVLSQKKAFTSQRRKSNTVNTKYVALLCDILIFWNVATLLEQGNIVRENPNLSKSNLNNDSHDSVGRTLTLTTLSIYQWPSNTQVQSFICLVSWPVDASKIGCFICAYSNSRVSQRYHQLWQRGIGRVVQLLRDASISCL